MALTKAHFDDSVSERERRSLDIARRAAEEGIVLLKNNGTLPIKSKRIALFGSGADFTVKGGTGSGEVKERHSVTVREGFERLGVEIMTEEYLDEYRKCYETAPRDSGFRLARA